MPGLCSGSHRSHGEAGVASAHILLALKISALSRVTIFRFPRSTGVMTRDTFMLWILSAGIAIPVAAEPLTISHTVPITPSFFAETDASDSSIQFFSFENEIPDIPAFDPSLGELISVSVTGNGVIRTQTYLESQGILDPGISHTASVTSEFAQFDLLDVSDDEMTAYVLASTGFNFGAGCLGNPGDGDACFEIVDDELEFDLSVFDLTQFIGTEPLNNIRLSFAAGSLLYDFVNVDGAFVTFSGEYTASELTIAYTYEPEQAEPPIPVEAEFTGPKSGQLTVPTKPGLAYSLRMSATLEAATSTVLETRMGDGNPQVFSYSASAATSSAYYWIQESTP